MRCLWPQMAAAGASLLNSGYKPGCKRCAMKVTARLMSERKLGIGALQDYAKSFGGRCLSSQYIDAKSLYDWVCQKGHEFRRPFDAMKSKKSFCPTCGLGKGSNEDLHAFAKKHNGKWLSKEFVTGTTKYEWSCSQNHVFLRTYNQMKSARQFCVACETSERGVLEMREFAQEHGGALISKSFTTNKQIYEWRCSAGHVFQRKFALMKAKQTFCNECTRLRQGIQH